MKIRISKNIRNFLRERFDLSNDKLSDEAIFTEINQASELRGSNLWALVIAIFIASIGLNVNSTAVIIGAMLISPLMGPIIGIGFGVAVYDFELIKKAARNIGFAALISLAASTFYFFISPLDRAQSELLARTSPTIWDVFIAFLGGIAGFIGNTRASKNNVVPGVAIATALMPPLCTAGYGLGSGQPQFFIGALYFFFINCVFISAGTFLGVGVLQIKSKVFPDIQTKIKVRRYLSILVVVTFLPSVYLAYKMLASSVQERKIQSFLKSELVPMGVQILSFSQKEIDEGRLLEVNLVGPKLLTRERETLSQKMRKYGLFDFKLELKNLSGNQNLAEIKSTILTDLYKNTEGIIKTKEDNIKFLESELEKYRNYELPLADILNELKIIEPHILNIIGAKIINREVIKPNLPMTTLLIAIEASIKINIEKKFQIERWLVLRTKSDEIKALWDIKPEQKSTK